ncbi:PucR family transcriptional regulator ligand-binding domain-containing protein [Thermomicrobium sp. 4228-Ro]|uniref:PucR family transcriptional regulator n=1 Tax=Thermomicrobium sp. 4228-Ro TaxID=2993937 RepID=UPI0022491734|nr:PucR family transcriptional regulator [Thermomicrobium sp. 4228-Ro]MCX2726809.1 PucR family transcriptional regulator ligand-binding domain-containing protein [Thermomicrobium sp. 4228-Ro]
MPITVRELLERPDLKTRLIAGAGGVDRVVTWAHVCELEDPTVWLCGGELVMTVGIGLPRDPAGQVAYVERLARAQLAGLMICEGMKAPPLSPEMLSAADRLALPVMLTAYEVPFVAVSRVVADANLEEEHRRLRQTVQVYDVARLVVHGELDETELIGRLERIVGARLAVVDPASGRVLMPSDRAGDAAFVQPLRRVIERYPPGQLPAVLQVSEAGAGTVALAVPTHRPVFLVVPQRMPVQRDIVTLRHVATVLALALERERAERERQYRFGSELFAHLADGRLPSELALELLRREHGFPEPPYVVVAVTASDRVLPELQDELAALGIPHVALRRDSLAYLLLPEPALVAIERVGTAAGMGASQPVRTLARVPEAMVEARWALERLADGQRLARFGEGVLGAGHWPLSVEAARELVDRVLGPLEAHDARQGTQLVRTLATFLAHDGSWSATARALGIHRQTLVYRVRRIEQLTGCRVDRVSELATLYLALEAARALGRLSPDSSGQGLAASEDTAAVSGSEARRGAEARELVGRARA